MIVILVKINVTSIITGLNKQNVLELMLKDNEIVKLQEEL